MKSLYQYQFGKLHGSVWLGFEVMAINQIKSSQSITRFYEYLIHNSSGSLQLPVSGHQSARLFLAVLSTVVRLWYAANQISTPTVSMIRKATLF